MALDGSYYYENQSAFYRAMEKHFAAKGVVGEYKMSVLITRWIKRKGYRFPVKK